jgi:hypothetical protein
MITGTIEGNLTVLPGVAVGGDELPELPASCLLGKLVETPPRPDAECATRKCN